MRRCFSLAFLLLALAGPAWAQEEGSLPHLGEHLFVPVTAMPEPFITTHLDMSVGLGWTVNSTVPVYSLEDSTLLGHASADQLLTGLDFGYQQSVRDWMAVNVELTIVGRLGTDTSSLLAQGVTGALSYQIGWLMRIHESEKTFLSGSVNLGNGAATFVNLAEWFYGMAQGLDVDLVRQRNSLDGAGGLHFGWGISRRFGLLAYGSASYGESFTGIGENAWHSDVRLALSYDLRHDLKVPLGLALTTGRFEGDFSGDDEAGSWFWNLRLALQGRSDFSLGLEFGGNAFERPESDDKIQTTQFNLSMRYYY